MAVSESGYSAASPGLDDHIAIRQSCAHLDGATFSMMPIPTVVMAAVNMSVNHDIVSIMDDNLRRRRTSTYEHRPHGRS
jgi:hypothetical protein